MKIDMTFERQQELPKRARYYQSIIDSAILPTGAHYKDLPETYIIFICTYDPFGKGLYKYTFDAKCNEIDLPEYLDGAHKIFFNTTADLREIPQEQQNMLRYIETGDVLDKATQQLESEVQEARLKEEWRAEYMLTVVHDRDVYADGYDKGVKSRQSEIDDLKLTISDMDTIISDKNTIIAQLQSEIQRLSNK